MWKWRGALVALVCALAFSGCIRFAWQASTSVDVVAYQAWECVAPCDGSGWTRLGQIIPAKDACGADGFCRKFVPRPWVEFATPAFYAVTALTADGQESDLSNIIGATLPANSGDK